MTRPQAPSGYLSRSSNPVPMRKIVLTFGLIAGGILSVMMLATIPFIEQIGFSTAEVIGYSTMVLAFLMIYFGIRSYRDSTSDGSVTFGRAFQVGILITLIAAVCYAATWQLIYYRIVPDFMDKYSAYALEKERASGATEQVIEQKRQDMARYVEMYRNPLINVAITLVEPLPVGLVMTVISSGLLGTRRRRVGAAGQPEFG